MAILKGRRRVHFRTALDPEHLRGPNLSWIWLDEAALMKATVWGIALGRLRLAPRRAWLTTTPRGNRNWTHTTFEKGGETYRTIPASTRDAFWHPPEFVASMVANYSHDFALQELDGAVLDDAQEGLLPLWWLGAMETAFRGQGHPGRRRLGADLGYGTGKDSFSMVIRDNLGILYAFECAYVGIPQAAQLIAEKSFEWGVGQEDITYDANGPGRDLPPYLESYRITEAMPYHGSSSGGPNAVNRRSRCAWALRQRIDPGRPMPMPGEVDLQGVHPLFRPETGGTIARIQAPFCLPADRPWWPRLKEELEELKFSTVARKVALEKKEDLAARLKRSPDVADALLMTFNEPDWD